MNTGSIIGGRPSLGSWVSYGLGSENANLPGFVVIEDNQGQVVNGPRNWGAGFMPAVYQGTALLGGEEPIKHLVNPKGVTDSRQRQKLALLAELNRRHAAERPEQTELDARIASYELAFRMQAEAPETVDLSTNPRRDARDVRPRPQGDREVRPDVPASPAGWSSGACGSCSFIPARAASGTPTRTSKRTTATTACRSISRWRRC
jgi:hypothetical protein